MTGYYYWRLFPMGAADSDKMAAFLVFFVSRSTLKSVQLHSFIRVSVDSVPKLYIVI